MENISIKFLKEKSNNSFTLRDFFYYFHHSEILPLNIFVHVGKSSRLNHLFEGRIDNFVVNPSGDVPFCILIYLDCPVIVVDFYDNVFTIVLSYVD